MLKRDEGQQNLRDDGGREEGVKGGWVKEGWVRMKMTAEGMDIDK